ncbi:MAG: hypothetical protein ALECFALPRED_008348 [Alectoria fallacina]|uniref:Uncharacterized protein n=1 Tax=Alectoria fallacina TaxID=1903189 RepID=A0A8H3J336_9LECA|nr:MAG: hypothetical protein ALECFALPRED_008348 [Alectoria fallacina]
MEDNGDEMDRDKDPYDDFSEDSDSGYEEFLNGMLGHPCGSGFDSGYGAVANFIGRMCMREIEYRHPFLDEPPPEQQRQGPGGWRD